MPPPPTYPTLSTQNNVLTNTRYWTAATGEVKVLDAMDTDEN